MINNKDNDMKNLLVNTKSLKITIDISFLGYYLII